MGDEPKVDVGGVGDVGEEAQRCVREGMRAQHDQLAGAFGAQMHIDETPQRVTARPEVRVFAQRAENAAGQAARAAGGRGFADDLAERASVQATQPVEGVQVVVRVEHDGQGAFSGPRHRAGRAGCGQPLIECVVADAALTGAARCR